MLKLGHYLETAVETKTYSGAGHALGVYPMLLFAAIRRAWPIWLPYAIPQRVPEVPTGCVAHGLSGLPCR
jgi:hypothetical protein